MWFSLQPRTGYETEAFTFTDTAAKKENIRKNYVRALIAVLIIIIVTLSSILIGQKPEEENGGNGITSMHFTALKT